MNTHAADLSKLGDKKISELLSIGIGSRTASDGEEPVAVLRSAFKAADSELAQQLLSYLDSTVLSPDRGPLSFRQLTGMVDIQAKELADKSFVHALSSKDVGQATLHAIAEYGRMLSQMDLPEAANLTGVILRSLAQAALALQFDDPIPVSDAHQTKAVLTCIAGLRRMPAPLRILATQALAHLYA